MNGRFMMLENKLCKELELLEEKYRTGAEMSEGDLRKIDLLAHSMKSLAAYIGMKSSEMPQYETPAPMNSMNSMNSYNNNYGNASYMDNSYGMRMSREGDMSGHYPYPMYREERRW